MVNQHDKIVEMLRNLIESQQQAEHDFCGEQRSWHVKRLNRAFLLATELFPLEVVEAMGLSKNPYGDSLV